MDALRRSDRLAVLKGRVRFEWVALAMLMALAAALILYMGRGLTFFRDEWTFVLYRDGHDPANFLSSYAGHLVLWPTALYVFLFHAIGLDQYGLYRLVGLPWHLACALLVYLLARRRVGDVVALAPAGILLFLGSAWMDILWPFQVVFTGAIAFGLAAILALEKDDLPGDALACLSLTIAVGWSGAALPFLPGVAAGLLVRRRLWRRIWVVGVPAVVYLSWLLKYGEQQTDYAENLPHIPSYVLEAAGAGLTGISGLAGAAGPYLAVLLGLVVAVRLWQLGRSSPLAWEALVLAISFWGLTAVARAQEGDPTAVRYIYPSAVFLMLLAVGLAPAGKPRRWVASATLVLAALCLPSNLADLNYGSDALRSTSQITSAELGAVQLARNRVAPDYAPGLDGFPNAVPAAPFFAATDRYGSSPADSPLEIAGSREYARRLADVTSIAALRVRLRGLPVRVHPPGAQASFRATAGSSLAQRNGCASAAGGRVDLVGVVPAGGLSIRSSASRVAVALRRFGHGFHRLTETVPPESRRFLSIPADSERTRPWRVRIVSRRGPVQVC